MSIVQKFLNSMMGKFIIGGLTVTGISFVSNNLGDTILAGIIASIPIGMPSTIFVNDNNIKSYTWNLLVMTSELVLSTIVNYYLINHAGYNKYESVSISMLLWITFGALFYIAKKILKIDI